MQRVNKNMTTIIVYLLPPPPPPPPPFLKVKQQFLVNCTDNH